MMAVLRVLLFLLKCLGILLLILLGLILLVLVLALFAPVRYKGHLKKAEESEEIFTADGLVSWLNPLIRVRIRFVEKKLCYAVRVFGLCLINSEKPKKEKKPSKEKKKKGKKEKKKKEKRKKSKGKAQETEPIETVDTTCLADVAKKDADEDVTESFGKTSDAVEAEQVETGQNAETKETVDSAKASNRLKLFFEKIKNFIRKIKEIPAKVKKTILHFTAQVKLLWHKKEKVFLFLEDEFHLLAMGKAWATVKKLFGHVLPGKIKGQVVFGTGDPESTGKALAALGILYAAYGKGLTVVPDFYEKHLIAEIKFKGRIRFGTLLWHILKLIRDKHVKRFYKNWKKLLKILKQKAE